MKTAINLFAMPKAKQSTKTKEKQTFRADILADKISQFMALKDQIEAATGQIKMLEGDIKDIGRELFLKEYRKGKVKPESFKIEDKTGASCLFICMDKYTTVDETKAEVLRNFDGLLEEKQTFKINSELVEKYAETLSELILKSKKISDEDKANLIQGELAYSVKKGSIDRLMQYDNPDMVFELINPIVSLKK